MCITDFPKLVDVRDKYTVITRQCNASSPIVAILRMNVLLYTPRRLSSSSTSTRDPHRTVYGYDRKNYGYLRVLTGRNRNRIHSLMALYGTVTVTVRLLRPYTVVKSVLIIWCVDDHRVLTSSMSI
jgi:hypothetical protein